jgi:hypothetical protein
MIVKSMRCEESLHIISPTVIEIVPHLGLDISAYPYTSLTLKSFHIAVKKISSTVKEFYKIYSPFNELSFHTVISQFQL